MESDLGRYSKVSRLNKAQLFPKFPLAPQDAAKWAQYHATCPEGRKQGKCFSMGENTQLSWLEVSKLKHLQAHKILSSGQN